MKLKKRLKTLRRRLNAQMSVLEAHSDELTGQHDAITKLKTRQWAHAEAAQLDLESIERLDAAVEKLPSQIATLEKEIRFWAADTINLGVRLNAAEAKVEANHQNLLGAEGAYDKWCESLGERISKVEELTAIHADMIGRAVGQSNAAITKAEAVLTALNEDRRAIGDILGRLDETESLLRQQSDLLGSAQNMCSDMARRLERETDNRTNRDQELMGFVDQLSNRFQNEVHHRLKGDQELSGHIGNLAGRIEDLESTLESYRKALAEQASFHADTNTQKETK